MTGGLINGIINNDWSMLQRQATSLATAFIFSGGNPFATMASFMAMSILDTPPGRQLTKFTSEEIFDDAFGMSPRAANVVGNMVTHAVVSSAIYIAITPGTYTGSDFRDSKNQTEEFKNYGKDIKGNGGTSTNTIAKTNPGSDQWIQQGRIASQNGWSDVPVAGDITKALGINHTAAVVQTADGSFFDSALDSNLINPLKTGDLWGSPWTGTCQQVCFTTLVEKGGASGMQAFKAVAESSGWTYYATSAIYGVRADFGGVGIVNGVTNQYYDDR